MTINSKLNYVVSGLKKIIASQSIDKSEFEYFQWVAYLTSQMDLNFKYNSNNIPNLGILATKLRPDFYKNLINLGINFDLDLSKRIYDSLISGGTECVLNQEELDKTSQLYGGMIKNIQIYLQQGQGQI